MLTRLRSALPSTISLSASSCSNRKVDGRPTGLRPKTWVLKSSSTSGRRTASHADGVVTGLPSAVLSTSGMSAAHAAHARSKNAYFSIRFPSVTAGGGLLVQLLEEEDAVRVVTVQTLTFDQVVIGFAAVARF